MSNFGFLELRVVNPYEVAFREAKSAVKARAVLEKAREFSSLAEAVADCALVVGTTSKGHRALEHPLRRLETGARIIRKKLGAAPVAVLFGSEKFGLSNEDMSHCHWLMRIPTREAHGSMNLGQAVAVCLYELVRNPAAARATPEPRRPASAGSRKIRLRARARRRVHRAQNPPPGPPPGPERARRRSVAGHAAADFVEIGIMRTRHDQSDPALQSASSAR